jgi:glycogen debranching enzyme
VIRQRSVAAGFHEDLTILNHADKSVTLDIRIEAASDFADLFEVKDALRKKGTYSTSTRGGTLVLGYDRGPFSRATEISATKPVRIDSEGLSFRVRVPAHGEWTTGLDVVTARLGGGQAPVKVADPARARARMARDLDRWVSSAPRIECDWDALKTTYRRSLVDLAALRFSPPIAGGRSLPAAGLPWFMTMFGRDSVFTSLQALPFTPSSLRRRCVHSETGRASGSTTSATRTPVGSCTRCDTAR